MQKVPDKISPYCVPGLRPQSGRRAKHSCERDLIRKCAEVFGTTPEAMQTKSRKTEAVTARYVAMHLLRFAFNYSLHEAGFVFLKDHATVSHGTKTVRNRMRYKDFRERYDKVCSAIGFE